MFGNYILVFTSAKLRLFPCFHKDLLYRLLLQYGARLLFSAKPLSSGNAKQHHSDYTGNVSHAKDPFYE